MSFLQKQLNNQYIYKGLFYGNSSINAFLKNCFLAAVETSLGHIIPPNWNFNHWGTDFDYAAVQSQKAVSAFFCFAEQKAYYGIS